MSPTTAALTALSDLVDSARALAARARKKRRADIATRLDGIAERLDATRTRLVQEGSSYIPTAWVFVDTGRAALATWRKVLT